MTCDEVLSTITSLSSPRRWSIVVRVGNCLHEVVELTTVTEHGQLVVVIADESRTV